MSDGRFSGVDWASEEHAACVVDEQVDAALFEQTCFPDGTGIVETGRSLSDRAESGSVAECAASATNQKRHPSAAEFRVGSIVSWKAASTRVDACALSALNMWLVESGEVRVAVRKQVCPSIVKAALLHPAGAPGVRRHAATARAGRPIRKRGSPRPHCCRSGSARACVPASVRQARDGIRLPLGGEAELSTHRLGGVVDFVLGRFVCRLLANGALS